MYNHIDRVINFALQYSRYPPSYPIEIGEIILRIYPEPNLLTSAILYSTIDTSSRKNISKRLKQIKGYFGSRAAHKISNITKFSNYEYIAHDLTQIHKFTSALNLVDKTTSSSILLIKLASLLHSLSVFNNYYILPNEQIKLVSLDILEVYLPLISEIDIEDVKIELQEFCTKILYPDLNKEIKKYLGVIESSEEFLNDVVEDLNKELSNSQIKATVSGRIKSYYSIWRKLHYKNTTIEKINDIIGLRIIVDNIDDCYSALKVVHHRYQSVPKKFHDFINIPKGNGYKSLHTVIIGPKSQKLEVQIRTTEMHQVAQRGSAAHLQYKNDFTKIISVFIAAQKLYTKPTVNLTTPNTVNLTTPNSVMRYNNSKVNIHIQQNTIVIHMSFIGLLATDKNQQSIDDKVATDENQYIALLQTEYTDNRIIIQRLVYGFIDLLFKFIQNNVYDQIMIFIVESHIGNLVSISVEANEHKAQEFWDDISYISNNYNMNGNQQHKNSKNVSSYLKQEVIIICSHSDVHSKFLQMLAGTNSVVAENIDIAKTTTLTNIESNSNKMTPEQTTQEEQQEINSTQDSFSATLPVSNISDNTTNITNVYEPELQNEGVKFTNDVVQYFQLPFNTEIVGEEKDDNAHLEYNSANEGDNESAVVLNSENRTANFENEGTNSTNIIELHAIQSRRYAVKIFCAIMQSRELEKQLRSIVEDDLSHRKHNNDNVTNPSGCNKHLIDKKIYYLLNSYESICPENIDLIFNFVDTDRIQIENTKQNISIVNELINFNICQGPQMRTGNAITKYFRKMLTSNYIHDREMTNMMKLSITLCLLYYIKYDNTSNRSVLSSGYTKEIAESNNIGLYSILGVASLQKNWNSEADIESNKKNQDSNKLSGNKGNTDQDTKIIEFVKTGNLTEVYDILCNCSEGTKHTDHNPKLKNILNIKDEDGNTPILLAIREGNFPMTMLLLGLGNSNLNVENNTHETPLSLAFTSLEINKCIINLLIHKMLIKYKEQLSIQCEKFQEFVIKSQEFKQFYNACRSYVEKFSSIMIIDLLVEMSIVSPDVMKNLVAGLYCKSYIEGDGEFREYFKCIGSVDTDIVEADCEMMMYNYYSKTTERKSKENSVVPKSSRIPSIENIKKMLKCFYVLQQSKKQLLIIDQMMTQHSQHLKIKNKKVIDTKGMQKPWKCQSDVDHDAEPTIYSTIDKYIIKTTIECSAMIYKTDARQERLIEDCKLLDECLLKGLKKIVEEMTRPIQQCEYSSDDDESITNDAITLHTLCTEVAKVMLLAKASIEFFVINNKNILTEYFTKKYEEMLESIHKVKELSCNVYTFTTLEQKDLSVFGRKAFPALSDTKILPECSIIKFLREDPIINAEDKESLIEDVRDTMAKDVDDIQQMDDILSHVAHEIGLKMIGEL